MFHFTFILLLAAIIADKYNLYTNSETMHASMAEYVQALYENGFILSKYIRDLMNQVDRKHYVNENPYDIFPIDIGYGSSFGPVQMQAFALEHLREHVKEGSKVLDVGSGTGYVTVCLALMAGKTGHVVGIEHIPELVKNATENTKKDKPFLFEENRIQFIEGDGRLGVPDYGPYDAIHIGAVVNDNNSIPQDLMDQLKPGGRLVVLVDIKVPPSVNFHELMTVDKYENGTIVKELRDGLFAARNSEPLWSKKEQYDDSFGPNKTVKIWRAYPL